MSYQQDTRHLGRDAPAAEREVTQRQYNEEQASAVMARARNEMKAAKDAQAAEAARLAAITVSDVDVKLVAQQLNLPSAVAQTLLRRHNGNVEETFAAYALDA